MKQKYAFFFNPTCEMEVANGLANYMPPSQMQKFGQDLELLPLVYASPGDCVLVKTLPSAHFLERLESAGFDLPRFQLLNKLDDLADDFIPSPWGRSPAVAKRLASLGAQWNEALRPFFSRVFAREISLKLSEKNIPQTLDMEQVAQHVASLTDVENLLMACGKVVIKAPYSSSGRGIQMLHHNHLNVNIVNKTRSLIKQQGGVMVEPMLDVLCDMAFEFKLENKMLSFVGYSSFTTNEKGQYASHQIPFSPDNLPDEARCLWDTGVINAALEELQLALQESDLPLYYEGYFGVDAFVFHDQEGSVRLQPCVEINLRNNMGIVALYLEKHIAPGSKCEFKIATKTSVAIPLFDQDLANNYPLVMADNKMVSGYLPLSLPSADAQSLAYILVENKILNNSVIVEALMLLCPAPLPCALARQG